MRGYVDGFRDWAPVRVFCKDSKPLVEWCHMGEERFTEPFFEDSVRRRMRLPFNVLFRRQTPLESLGELVSKAETIPPTGFIFHMSRCGSTLVSQMLAALSTNIVISEAPPIDSVIAMRNGDPSGQVTKMSLNWMIAALGRRRTSEERRFFIKFDSWSTLDLDLITSAFPTVPFIFIYRNPIEVIVSQMNQRGSQMVPGAMETRLPELTVAAALSMSGEEYCARILASILESALKFDDDERMLFINYDQLPDAVEDPIASHFGVRFNPYEIAIMKETARFNAKTPELTFAADSEAKRAAASTAAREAAERFLDPLFKQLEERRLRRLS